MKIGVLGDTHVPDLLAEIPARVLDVLQGVDIILHVGDITRLSVLQQLEPIAQTFAVYGEQDSPEVKKYLQASQRLEFADRSIGLIHGDQAWNTHWLTRAQMRFSRTRRDQVLRAFVLREFAGVDVIVYGHTHAPYIKMHNGVLLFNPGTTLPRAGQSGSVGMLEVNRNSLKGKIIPIEFENIASRTP